LSEEAHQKPALLLVEDDTQVLAEIERALESTDFDVVSATSGNEALKQAESTQFFLVLMDISFEDMNGFELADKLQEKLDSKVPLILLTDMDRDQSLTDKGYEAGAVDFIYKPASPVVLASKAKIFFDLHLKEQQLLAGAAELRDTNRKFKQELRERRKMELAVQESEVRYRSLLELSPVSIVVEVDDQLSYLNTAVLNLLGEEDREHVTCRSLLDYVHERHREKTRAAIQKIKGQGGRADPFETKLVRRDESEVDLEVYGACVMYEGEVGVQMALQDITERKLLEAEWRRLSRMDGLTGIYNRRAFDEVIDREHRRALRDAGPISLALIDIDAFKKFNDNYGHQRGDDALKQVAAVLSRECARGGDHVARYGGEEFAIVMANTGYDGAMTAAERVRKSVESIAIKHDYNPAAPVVTISTGVCTVIPSEEIPTEVLIKHADERLYEAKESGRNRVCGINLVAALSSD